MSDPGTCYILYFVINQWQQSKSFVTNHKDPALFFLPYQSWSRVFSNTTAVMVLTTNIGKLIISNIAFNDQE